MLKHVYEQPIINKFAIIELKRIFEIEHTNPSLYTTNENN